MSHTFCPKSDSKFSYLIRGLWGWIICCHMIERQKRVIALFYMKQLWKDFWNSQNDKESIAFNNFSTSLQILWSTQEYNQWFTLYIVRPWFHYSYRTHLSDLMEKHVHEYFLSKNIYQTISMNLICPRNMKYHASLPQCSTRTIFNFVSCNTTSTYTYMAASNAYQYLEF